MHFILSFSLNNILTFNSKEKQEDGLNRVTIPFSSTIVKS